MIYICNQCYFFRVREYMDGRRQREEYICAKGKRENIDKISFACEDAKPHDWRPISIKKEK